MNDLNEEDFWRELFVVKMRREERMIAALQANPDPKTSMQRPMTWAACEASPPSMPEEEKRKDTFNRSFSGKIEDLGQRSNAERRLIEPLQFVGEGGHAGKRTPEKRWHASINFSCRSTSNTTG